MSTLTSTLRLTKPNFNAAGWDDELNNNFDVIDAAVAQSIFFVGFRGTWAVSTAYAVNDIAIDSAATTTYKCLVAHTSPASGTFSDSRAANPSYWALQSTAEASAAAAAISAINAQTSANNAATSATGAATQASSALTQATNAAAFASAAQTAALAAATSAIAASQSVSNQRAAKDVPTVAATTNNDFTLAVPAGYIVAIYWYTTVAYTGGTVNVRVGTTVGDNDIADAVAIAALGQYTLPMQGAIMPLVAPYGGGTFYIRVAQSAPTTVGSGKLLVALLPQ